MLIIMIESWSLLRLHLRVWFQSAQMAEITRLGKRIEGPYIRQNRRIPIKTIPASEISVYTEFRIFLFLSSRQIFTIRDQKFRERK